MIDCIHLTPNPRGKGQGTCAAGLYDGRPWPGNCLACEHKNKPLAEVQKVAAEVRYERTHPEKHRGITGCC